MRAGISAFVIASAVVFACQESPERTPLVIDDGDGGGVRPPVDEPEPDEDAGPSVPAACAAALEKLSFPFDGDDGWTHGVSDGADEEDDDWPFDPWTRGTAKDPECPDDMCYGAERGQNYVQCQRGFLLSPPIDLTACEGSSLAVEFRHTYAFWTGTVDDAVWFDGGIVEISNDDGRTWLVPDIAYPGTVKINPSIGFSYRCVLPDAFHVDGKPGFVGTETEVKTVRIPLTTAMLTSQFRVRFSQGSGVSSETTDPAESRRGTAAGWRVDDVKVVPN